MYRDSAKCMLRSMLNLIQLEGKTQLPEGTRQAMSVTKVRQHDPSLPLRMRVTAANDWVFCHTDGAGYCDVEWPQSLGQQEIVCLLVAGSGVMSMHPPKSDKADLAGRAILVSFDQVKSPITFRGGISHHLVTIPKHLLPDTQLYQRAVPLFHGPAMLLAAMIRTVELQLSSGDDEEFAAIAPVLISLIEATFRTRSETTVEAVPTRRQLVLLLEHIAANIEDTELSPKSCAAACGLSVRQLHRLLHDHGESFATLLRRARLERAAALLQNKSNRRIADIATDAGFSSAAHFATLFRAAYGMTPREWRERKNTVAPRS